MKLDEIDLCKLTLEEVGELERLCHFHIGVWFSFDRKLKPFQTPEFIEKTKWRLEGKMEPCCECGADYPREDLHFGGHIYCPACREIEEARTRNRTIPSPP